MFWLLYLSTSLRTQFCLMTVMLWSFGAVFTQARLRETQQGYWVKMFCWKSGSSVFIVTGCVLKAGFVPCSNRNFAVSSSVQNVCGAHTTQYLTNNGCYFHGRNSIGNDVS